jgi:hypothetical protein
MDVPLLLTGNKYLMSLMSLKKRKGVVRVFVSRRFSFALDLKSEFKEFLKMF